jgi:galactonate dehydratase
MDRMPRRYRSGEIAMKISRLEYVVMDTGRGRTWLFIEIYTDNGLIGVGEASQSRLDRGVVHELEQLAPLYVGHDPFTLIEERTRLLKRPDAGRTLHCAVSGLEQALWDLCGQAAGQPIHHLLGGPIRTEVPLYANLAMAVEKWTPGPLAAAANEAVREGFKAIKFNLFPVGNGRSKSINPSDRPRALANAREIVKEVRAAVGPDIAILTDWTLAVTPKEGHALADAIEEFGLLWIEEPFVLGDPTELAAFRRSITPRLTVGEQILKRSDFRPLLEARAADVINPDVKWIGGILEARKLAAMADTCEIEISPHNMSGPVATAASVHLSAICPNFLTLEYCWHVPEWRQELVAGAEQIVDGAIPLPSAPGLGITWDPAAARKRALASGAVGR